MGCVEVGFALLFVSRTLRLPGRGCDPALIRFYLAEVRILWDSLFNR